MPFNARISKTRPLYNSRIFICHTYKSLNQELHFIICSFLVVWDRLGTINSKSFDGTDKWKFELTVHFKHEIMGKHFTENLQTLWIKWNFKLNVFELTVINVRSTLNVVFKALLRLWAYSKECSIYLSQMCGPYKHPSLCACALAKGTCDMLRYYPHPALTCTI